MLARYTQELGRLRRREAHDHAELGSGRRRGIMSAAAGSVLHGLIVLAYEGGGVLAEDED